MEGLGELCAVNDHTLLFCRHDLWKKLTCLSYIDIKCKVKVFLCRNYTGGYRWNSTHSRKANVKWSETNSQEKRGSRIYQLRRGHPGKSNTKQALVLSHSSVPVIGGQGMYCLRCSDYTRDIVLRSGLPVIKCYDRKVQLHWCYIWCCVATDNVLHLILCYSLCCVTSDALLHLMLGYFYFIPKLLVATPCCVTFVYSWVVVCSYTWQLPMDSRRWRSFCWTTTSPWTDGTLTRGSLSTPRPAGYRWVYRVCRSQVCHWTYR